MTITVDSPVCTYILSIFILSIVELILHMQVYRSIHICNVNCMFKSFYTYYITMKSRSYTGWMYARGCVSVSKWPLATRRICGFISSVSPHFTLWRPLNMICNAVGRRWRSCRNNSGNRRLSNRNLWPESWFALRRVLISSPRVNLAIYHTSLWTCCDRII